MSWQPKLFIRVGIILFLAGQAIGAPKSGGILKPKLERAKMERTPLEPLRRDKPTLERPKLEYAKVERLKEEALARDRSEFEKPSYDSTFHVLTPKSVGNFPKANLHRRIPIYGGRETDYRNGRKHKFSFRNRIRHLQNGKIDPELDF